MTTNRVRASSSYYYAFADDTNVRCATDVCHTRTGGDEYIT